MGAFARQEAAEAATRTANVRYVAPTAAVPVTLQPGETTILVTTPAADVGPIYLPAPPLNAGKILTFRALNTGGGGVSLNGAVGFAGTAYTSTDNLEAANDYIVLYCDGVMYCQLVEACV